MHIKVVNAVSNYTQLKNVVKNAPAGNGIQINIGGNLTASSGDTEIEVSGGKNLKLIPSPGSPIYKINANENGRIFKISGSGNVLNLEDIKLEGGNAADGGAVHVKTSGKLVLKGKTVITPSTGSDENTPGKNDVYLASGASIQVDSTLTGTTPANPIVARITPQNYSEGTQVLIGVVGSEYTKFSVTQPADSTDIWTIKNNGTLKAIPTIINGGSGAWKRLKDAVEKLPEGSTITIDGEITATSDSGNSGEIVIDKNLTIQGKSGAGLDILNANSSGLGTNAHRIFKVEPGKKLTLKNLTLKGGKAKGDTLENCGGAVYVKAGGKLDLTQVNMNNNHAALKGGAVYFVGHGGSPGPEMELTVRGGEFTDNKAKDTFSGDGGAFALIAAKAKMEGVKIKQNFAGNGAGIYVGTGSVTSYLILTNSGTYGSTEISNNGTLDTLTASNGGGIYFHSGSLTINNGVQIKQNKAEKGGGIYVIDASCTMFQATTSTLELEISGNTASHFGAGIYLHKSSVPTRLAMSGGKISGNSVVDTYGNLTGEGGGIYTESTAEISLNGGTIENNQAAKGGAVYANNQCNFSIKNSARITPSSGSDEDKPGKNDVYLDNGKMITVDGELNPAGGIAARITVADSQYNTSTQVLTAGLGVNLANEHTKFTVTPKGSEEWEIGSDGKLKKAKVIDGGTEKAWKKLRDAVQSAVNGDVITISGTIKATNASGNSGEIEINNKNITIKRAKGATTAVLDANSTGGDKPSLTHRIFNIKGTSKVHLENITIKNGNQTIAASYAISGGGGIRMESTAELWLIGVTITDCTSKGNGGGLRMAYIASGGGKLTMKNSKIINNTVKDDDSADTSSGGGICLANQAYTAVIEDCEISGNKVDVSSKASSQTKVEGCGLYTGNEINSKTYIKGKTIIQGNSYIRHASKNTSVEGIGMWMQGGEVTIGEDGKSDSESPIIQNHQVGNADSVKGTAIYMEGLSTKVYWKSGQITNNGGSANAIYNAGGTLSNSSGHTAS